MVIQVKVGSDRNSKVIICLESFFIGSYGGRLVKMRQQKNKPITDEKLVNQILALISYDGLKNYVY